MRGFDPVVLQRQTFAYPQISGISRGSIFTDSFNRATLNPSGGYALYATTVIGAGSVSIANSQEVDLTTEAVINSYARCNMSELVLDRTQNLDSRTVIEIDIGFILASAVTSMEFFLGIVNNSISLAALPATQRYAGVYCDPSVDTSFQLASGNNVAQSLTDTNILPVLSNVYNINIIWSGTNTIAMDLTDVTAGGTSLGTKLVTDIGSSLVNTLQFIVNPEAALAKTLGVTELRVQAR